MTYGSSARSASYTDEPDLIAVRGDGGTLGYVLKTDLEGEVPKSPTEAIVASNHLDDRPIPVYDLEGEKVIDTFTVVAPDVSLETSKPEAD